MIDNEEIGMKQQRKWSLKLKSQIWVILFNSGIYHFEVQSFPVVRQGDPIWKAEIALGANPWAFFVFCFLHFKASFRMTFAWQETYLT